MTERRARLPARLSPAPLVVSAALSLACADDARWERSRSEYCQELELLAGRVEVEIAALVESMEGGLNSGCARADVVLQVLAARIMGFSTTVHVLARARPDDQTVEQAGFRFDLGVDALQRYDPSSCQAGKNVEAARQIADIKARVAEEFDQGLANCTAIGWKSALRTEPAAPAK